MGVDPSGGSQSAFPRTHWSVVLAAGGTTTPGACTALAELCRTYWYPLYAFARRQGYPAPDAEDLTQGFFAHLIDVRLVGRADADKGRFRSFLLGAFRRFIVSEDARARAQKRGGGTPIESLNTVGAESRFGLDANDCSSPEKVFDRNWALTVLARALALLESEFKKAGRGALFTRLCPYLEGADDVPSYADVAQELGTTEGTIKVTVLRMRRRYGQCLRSVVAETLENPQDVEAELQHLRSALRRS